MTLIQERALSQLEQMPGDQVVKYLPALNSWLTQALERQNLELENAVGTQVLISTFAGEAGASLIAEWRDRLDDDVVSRWLSDYQDLSEIFLPVFHAIDGWRDYYGYNEPLFDDIKSNREPLLRAQRMTESMLKDPWIAAISKDYLERMGIYAIIEDCGVALASEIHLHGEELVSASSRPAFLNWLDLSRIASGAQQLALLDRAIDAALDDRERLRAKWLKVNALNDAHQMTAAKTLFEEIYEPLAKLAEEDGDEKLSESIREFGERFGD